MKTRLFLCAIGLFSIFLLCACSGYRLDSGQYTMTLKLDDQEENLPKLVFLEKDGKKVTIKSQQQTETLLGTLSGNELKITQSAAAKNITFLGLKAFAAWGHPGQKTNSNLDVCLNTKWAFL